MIQDRRNVHAQTLAPWILRLFLGISIFLRGLDFVYTTNSGIDSSASIAGNIIALSEMSAGIGIMLGGVIYAGDLSDRITRFSGLLVVLIMSVAFYRYAVYSDVMLSFDLFKSEKIGLFALGLYFLLRGNN